MTQPNSAPSDRTRGSSVNFVPQARSVDAVSASADGVSSAARHIADRRAWCALIAVAVSSILSRTGGGLAITQRLQRNQKLVSGFDAASRKRARGSRPDQRLRRFEYAGLHQLLHVG